MEPAGELWEGLSARERAQVAACCPDRHYPKGSVIFGPGHPPDALYVLLSGLITLSYLAEGGQESILRDQPRDGQSTPGTSEAPGARETAWPHVVHSACPSQVFGAGLADPATETGRFRIARGL
jgi:CRP-like cAMP-binding protein